MGAGRQDGARRGSSGRRRRPGRHDADEAPGRGHPSTWNSPSPRSNPERMDPPANHQREVDQERGDREEEADRHALKRPEDDLQLRRGERRHANQDDDDPRDRSHAAQEHGHEPGPPDECLEPENGTGATSPSRKSRGIVSRCGAIGRQAVARAEDAGVGRLPTGHPVALTPPDADRVRGAPVTSGASDLDRGHEADHPDQAERERPRARGAGRSSHPRSSLIDEWAGRSASRDAFTSAGRRRPGRGRGPGRGSSGRRPRPGGRGR